MISKFLVISFFCVSAVAAVDMFGERTPSDAVGQSSSEMHPLSKPDARRLIDQETDAVVVKTLENPLARIRSEEFAIISWRTLFSPLRREQVVVQPPVEAPVVQPVIVVARPPPAPDPDDFTLLGVVAANGEKIALLRWNKTQETMRLRPGDSYTGWKIAEINDRNVLIEQQGSLFSLMLFKGRSDDSAIAPPD
jgi:type II secretory pathway component PulC